MKKIICLLLVVAFIISAMSICVVAADDSGSPKHIPRIVSVVFDDSGSMFLGANASGYTDRWAYVSYAMQTFVAMMAPEDILHVTYISNTLPHDEVVLSMEEKQNSVDKFARMQFGGGTKNKLKEAADFLTDEYRMHGADAKYYYVVMADGVLDAGEGNFATDLPAQVTALEQALGGAEFDAIFFSMGQKIAVGDVRREDASTSDEIVTAIRDISAEIMGRTNITSDCNIGSGVLSFNLKYPAHSVTVFAQKTNADFENVSLALKKQGESLSYDFDTYYVECPEELTRSSVKPSRVSVDYPNNKDKEKCDPDNPPKGFVSIATNGDKPIPKGSYSVDLSEYDLKKDDVIVLVEPAVRIGCKYTVGDSQNVDFDKIKDHLTDGDTVKVNCGLYEINPDGSMGEQVSLDVLSPDYKFYINGVEVTEKDDKDENSFIFTINPDHADKEIKVEAMLEGYQPFIKRERLGKISAKIEFDKNVKFKDSVVITKKDWQDWIDGKIKLEYPLTAADSQILSKLSIRVDGYNGIKDGSCSDLDVTVSGKSIVLVPDVSKEKDFNKLPDSFTVSLCTDNKALATIKVTVTRPQYKLETENQLEGKTLTIDLLKDNKKSVIFTLMADYDGSGYEKAFENVIFKQGDGSITGDAKQDGASYSFTPKYDPNKSSPSDMLGVSHKTTVTAFVDGVEVASDTVSFSVSNASYKLIVENPITEAFTLDSIKDNDKKIVFTVLADYSGSGSFGSLADWDRGVYEGVTVVSDTLPGKYETLYDAGGKAIGKAFTPVYDENNNNGVVFTEVAGRVHEITAALNSLEIKTTVEVSAPNYSVEVKSEGFEIIETALMGNTRGVEYRVLRDGRILNEKELQGLAPYELSVKNDPKRITLTPTVKTDADGTSYILVVPTYNGCRFISPSLWNWMLPLVINNGENIIEYKLADIVTPASFILKSDARALIIAWIIIAIIIIIAWLIICQVFRVRFVKGKFYLISYTRTGNSWNCSYPSEYKSNKTRGIFPAFIIPGGCVKKNVGGIVFRTVKENFLERVIPTYVEKDNNTLVGQNIPCVKKLDPTHSMLKVAEAGGNKQLPGGKVQKVKYTESELGGTAITNSTSLGGHTVILKKLSEDSIIAVMFVPKK